MTNKVTSGLIMISILILCSGFTIYTPTILYSPLLKKSNDLNVSGTLGMSGTGLWNFSTAYALNDFSGITISTLTSNSNQSVGFVITSQSGNVVEYRKNAIEIGGGCFVPYGQKQNHLFQIYTGFGLGSVDDMFTERDVLKYDIQSRFVNMFIQFGFATTNDYFESSIDIKTKQVFAYKIQGRYLPYEDSPYRPDYLTINDKDKFYQIEPVYTLKAGSKNLKGIFQIGLILGDGYKDYEYENPAYSVSPVYMLANMFRVSLGLSYTFRH